MPPEPAVSRYDLHRFVTFVDACVAIAVTLLVLPLADAAVDIPHGLSFGDFLHENRGRMAAFLLSFAVIALMWLHHHRYLTRVARADTVLIKLTLAWTFTIVVLPFPTALISPYGSTRGLHAFYIGVLLANSALMALICAHVARTPALWAAGVTKADVSPARAVASTVTLAVAFVLAVAIPVVGFYALLLLYLPDRILDWRRWRTASP